MKPKVEIKHEHWEQARKDFPDDEMMAEIHAIRLAMHEAHKGLSPREIGKLYEKNKEEAA